MQFRSLVAAAAAVTLSTAQSIPNITAALASTSELSTLNTILASYPDLVSTLANATNITILAPSNSAFEAVLSTLTTLNETDTGAIPAILSYHVLNATVFSQNITSTPAFVPTLLTNETYTNVTSGQVVGARLVDNNVTILSGLGQTSNVVTADVQITNGVVHIIDRVLTLPESVADTASAAGLTALVGALSATNLTETVDGLSDITVFAPTNAAFEAIGSALGSLTSEQAASILQYHVINGTIAYSSLLSNTSVPSVEGANVNITIIDGEVFVNQARVISADVLVANGVVHVIDAVLNPNATATPDASESGGVVAYSGASSGAVPYTSFATATPSTTISVATTDAVASGYTPAPTSALSSQASSIASAASSTTGGAPTQTGAVGMAALFGGAVLLHNM